MATTTWVVACPAHTISGYATREDAERVAGRLNETAHCRETHAAITVAERLDMLAAVIIEATGYDPREDEVELFALTWGRCSDCGREDATAMLDLGEGEARRCAQCGI